MTASMTATDEALQALADRVNAWLARRSRATTAEELRAVWRGALADEAAALALRHWPRRHEMTEAHLSASLALIELGTARTTHRT